MTEEIEFQPGDVVQLKSGGPAMTVERVEKSQSTENVRVFCNWFSKVGGRQELNKESFDRAVLQKYQSNPGFRQVRLQRG
jgi:uncharacterized protein YodC (DUF2158 family)